VWVETFADDRGELTGEVAPSTPAPAPAPTIALMASLYPDLGGMAFDKDALLNYTFVIDR
jgi:hypothetical protein